MVWCLFQLGALAPGSRPVDMSCLASQSSAFLSLLPKSAARLLGLCALSILLGGFPACSTAPAVTRAEVLARAEAYCQHRWTAQTSNQKHGLDAHGVLVHTPDVTYRLPDGTPSGWWKVNAVNVGVPYQWGGFDSLTEFDKKAARGAAAGDVYTLAKRAALDAAVSREAAGIDCSGFISRCWGLRRSMSTREFPDYCQRLPDYSALLPGDILNTTNAHVYLFAGWADAPRTRAWVYEAATHPQWRVVKKQISVASLHDRGFIPLRHPRMRD